MLYGISGRCHLALVKPNLKYYHREVRYSEIRDNGEVSSDNEKG